MNTCACSRRDETEARLIQAEHDPDRARARLARLTGVETLPATWRDTYEVESPRGDIPQLVDVALRQRLDLATARAEVERARAERDLAATEYLPKVKLEFNQWTRMEGGFQDNLDWNRFDGGAREAEPARTLSVIRERPLAIRARWRLVELTPAGARVLKEILPGRLQQVSELLQGVTTERRTLVWLLRKLSAGLCGKLPSASAERGGAC